MEDNEPRVQLSGDSFDLDLLQWWSAQSKSPLYSIVEKDGKYWLKSPRFKQHEHDYSILEEAEKLMPIIIGSSRVRGISCESIGVSGRVVVNGKGSVFAHFTGAGSKEMRWKVKDKLYRKLDDLIYEPLPPFSPDFWLGYEGVTLELDERIKKGLRIDSYLHKLEERIDDLRIYYTFYYFVEKPRSWTSLWNTYEMIKFDVDDNIKEKKFTAQKCAIIRNGWATGLELKSFTDTANDYRAEHNPRHSYASFLFDSRPKSNPIQEQRAEERRKNFQDNHPLMRLGVAGGLIWRIFRGWCKWKASTY